MDAVIPYGASNYDKVGGGPWEGDGWAGSCAVSPAAAKLLAADVPLERIKGWLPGL